MQFLFNQEEMTIGNLLRFLMNEEVCNIFQGRPQQKKKENA